MKSNFFKYIFILFVIIIAACSIYLLYFNKKDEEIEQETLSQNKNQVEQITNLRLAISNFDNINPLISNNKEVLNIDKLIYEPLVGITEDYKLEMILAKECSKISDTSYIVKIDTNKKWHDGTTIIANDVKFTIDVLKQGRSVYSYNVQKILNTELIDIDTIRINLIEPVNFFEYDLTFPILPSHYYQDEDMYSSSKTPVGTGMFIIDEITTTNIRLKRNDKWWNKENLPKVDNVNIKLFGQIGEVYNSFKMKNLDIFTTYNNNLENYIGTMGYYNKEVKSREFNYLAFNLDNKILGQKEVRKAINYSIDRTNISSTVFNNNVFEANYPLDYGSYLYNKDNFGQNYSLENARKVLAENGWEYKSGNWQKKEGYSTLKINLKLTVNQEDEQKVKVAENIKNQLGQLGIKVTINKVSDTKYNEILVNKKYEMILTSVYNSFNPDLEFYFGKDNLQNYNNEEVQNILNEVRNISDEKLLKEKYSKLEQIYNEDIPFSSLYRTKIYVIKSQNLVGDLASNNYFSYYRFNTWYRIN